MQEAGEHYRPLVAEDGESGAVVGFADGGRERSGDPHYDGELYAIYLLQSAQRQGIGRQLVKAVAKELSSSFHAMLVWVLAQNEARRFYEALGGVYLRETSVRIAGKELIEVGYGWSDLKTLVN